MRHQATPPPRLSAGLKSQPPRYRFETAAYEQLQLIYVGSGALYFNEETRLEAGSLALLRVGSRFTLHTREEGYRGVFFISRGDGRPEFRGPALALSADAETRELARLMIREVENPGAGSTEVALGLGQALAWRAVRLAEVAGSRAELQDNARYWAERARGALEVTLWSGQPVRGALEPLGLCYRQLARHFTAVHGMSPKQYQLAARIREARRLLAETGMSVTAVAAELGYPSSQHFAAQFRAVERRTPGQWREHARRRKPVSGG